MLARSQITTAPSNDPVAAQFDPCAATAVTELVWLAGSTNCGTVCAGRRPAASAHSTQIAASISNFHCGMRFTGMRTIRP